MSFVCVLALYIASVIAQSTIQVFIPGFDLQPLVGSIVASDTAATTYAIACSPGTQSDECGVPGTITLTEGPSTLAYTFSYDSMVAGVSCKLSGTTEADCLGTASGASVGTDSLLSTQLQASEITFIPLTITAGAGVVNSVAASTTAAASASTNAAASLTTTSSTALSANSASSTTNLVTAVQSESSGTASILTSASSTPSSAGALDITGNVGYLLSGLVAAVAVV
ncbi:hypothetical protein MMC25_002116 [Agyrium rufum]|nr:hypothetical protein [Agyrium rufum]